MHINTNLSKFALGIPRCTECDLFLTVNGIKFGGKTLQCLCCGQVLRWKPRAPKGKVKYLRELALING